MKKLNLKTRIKVALLLMRVLKLQNKANFDEIYDFEYSSMTNEIDFIKLRCNEANAYRTVKCIRCYLNKDYGLTLDEFAEQIKIEEDSHK